MSTHTADSQMTSLLQTWRMVDAPAKTAVPSSTPADVPAIVQLAENLDLKAANPLAEQLLSLRGRAVQLDASQVHRIGGLCLQVLLSMYCTWRADGATISIINPSTRFAEGLALLGASAALSLEA